MAETYAQRLQVLELLNKRYKEINVHCFLKKENKLQDTIENRTKGLHLEPLPQALFL
jgi:hypothetical protein